MTKKINYSWVPKVLKAEANEATRLTKHKYKIPWFTVHTFGNMASGKYFQPPFSNIAYP